MPVPRPRSITFHFNLHTCNVLTQNQANHAFTKASIVKALRGLGSYKAEKYLEEHPDFEPFEHYKVRFEVFGLNRGMKIDPTNYEPTLKPLIDGCTGRLWSDDSAEYLVETTFAYGGLCKSSAENPIQRRHFHLTITETDPAEHITAPIPHDSSDETDDGYILDEAYPIEILPEDGGTNPNRGIQEYNKLVARAERKKAKKKQPKAAAALTPADPEDLEYKLEIIDPNTDTRPHTPADLNW